MRFIFCFSDKAMVVSKRKKMQDTVSVLFEEKNNIKHMK